MELVEKRLENFDIEMFPVRMGSGHTTFKIVDDLLFVTAIGPYGEDGKLAFTGRIGAEFTAEEGYKIARLVGYNMLQVIQDALGSFDKVDSILRCMSLVSAVKGNGNMNKVADGFSDVLVEKLGKEKGQHARNAVGASTLEGNAPILCDAIIKIKK